MLDGVRIRSIISDSRDRLWISTWNSYGLVCYDHGNMTLYSERDGLLSDRIRVVAERQDGSIIVANSGGVTLIENGEITKSYGKEDGIANIEILSVVEAENGDILAGSNGGGIYVIHEGEVRCIGIEDGLSSGIIMRIKKDLKRNLYWIIASNSISYMTSDYRVVTVRNFPYSNNFDLYQNSLDEMWILSSNGIYVIPTDSMLKNGDLYPVHYSMDNGLSCTATSNSYSELTESGELYMAGNNGIVSFNIEMPMESVTEIKASVPFIDADGETIYPDTKGNFVVPPRVTRLTIYGYVFDFSLTDPQITYRLRGFDAKSTTVSRRNFDPVVYTNLKGGDYEFVLQLKDSQGLISKTVSVKIEKKRAFYEQPLFHVAIGLALILLLGLAMRLYTEKKLLALEKKHREEAEKERINTELNMANAIQEGSLPHNFPPFPDRKEFDLYASMDPAREVGGDFYDFFLIDQDHLCLEIADVSGKGIPAALFMMNSKTILQNCAMLGQSPADILAKTNEAICANNKMEMFVTVWVGILEISTGIIRAANAGHEYPAVQKDGTFSLMKDRHGLVIGGMNGVRYREYEIQLEPGDALFLYTDGVPEAADSENDMFGTDRMLAVLNEAPGASPEEILRNVRSAVDGFVREAEQFDDLTMLCVRYNGKAAD